MVTPTFLSCQAAPRLVLPIAVAISFLTACPSGCDEENEEPQIHDWQPVELIHPGANWDVTDFALSFRFSRQLIRDSAGTVNASADQHQLQVDDNDDFSSPEIDVRQSAPGATYPDDAELFSHWTQMTYMPPELLPAGTYYWRVRVADGEGGPWSEPTTFTVNDDHTAAPLVQQIGPDAPLFTFDMFFDTGMDPLISRLPEIYDEFPTSLRPHLAFALHNESIGMHPELDDGFDGTFTDFLRPLSDSNVPILIKAGGPDKDFQQFPDLAEVENIFKTQPNVIGLLEGETFWDFIDGVDDVKIYENQVNWYKRSFQLAAKYGRVVIFGNGNDEFFAWDSFFGEETSSTPWISPEDIKAVSANLIPTAKNNIPFGYYQAESAIMGAWLADLTDNWGVWSEGWAWGAIGYSSLFGEQLVGDAEDPDFSTMPYNLWLQMKLAGLSQGATVFHFGGESSVVEWGEYDPVTGHFIIDDDEFLTHSTAFWDMEGNTHPALHRYIIPFLESVVSENLVPTKSEVLSKTKIAIAAPPLESDKGTALDYGPYASVFNATVGIDGYVSMADAEANDEDADYYELIPNACRRELLHNNGRYYMPPILPYPMDSLSDDTQILSLSQVNTEDAVHSYFDVAYPQRSTGNAWVVQVGDRIYINNSHENKDEAETFSMELDGLGIFAGTVQPHSYVLAKSTSDRIWIMANGGGKGAYTDDRTTHLTLTLTTEPAVTSSDGDVSYSWANGTLSLELSHETGAASVIVVP
jgi:hypothetical protein